MDDIQSQAAAIVQRVAEVKAPIDPALSLFDAGLLDSFALPALVAALEQTFHITIPDSDLNADTFESIGKIAEYVRRCRS